MKSLRYRALTCSTVCLPRSTVCVPHSTVCLPSSTVCLPPSTVCQPRPNALNRMSTTLNRIYTVSLPYLYRIYTVLYRTVTQSTALNRGLAHLYRGLPHLYRNSAALNRICTTLVNGIHISNLNHGGDTVHRGWLTVSARLTYGGARQSCGRDALDRGWVRWSALERGRFLVFDMSKTRKSLGGSVAVDSAVQHSWTRSSTVEHGWAGRETVEIRYTAVQRGSFNRTLPRSTAARWDLGITNEYRHFI